MSCRTFNHRSPIVKVAAGLYLRANSSTRDGRTRPAPIFDRCRTRPRCPAATKGGDRDVPIPDPTSPDAPRRRAQRTSTSRSPRPAPRDLEHLPYTVKVLLENMLRGAATQPDLVERRRRARAGGVGPDLAGRGRAALHAGAGHPPGLHRRAVRRRPRRHARRDGRDGRRPVPHQPARAGRPRHRSLGAGRPVRLGRGVPHQRRARVRAQRRALRAPALGAAGLRRLPRRAARDRHRPPGQPRVPRRRRRRARRRARCPTPWSAPTRTRR